MHLKPHFVYENKTIFIYFLTISGVLHIILIFLSSNLSYYLKPKLTLNNPISNKSSYVIEIDLDSGMQEEERIASEVLKEEELKEEELRTVAEVSEEKRNLFVDTSDKVVDEEPQAETNKIGEKGSIARDMYAGREKINDNPRLESESDFPGKIPDELASAIRQESGLPIEVSFGVPVEKEIEETTQALKEEETVDKILEGRDGEELADDEETVALEEIRNESVVETVEDKEPAPQIINNQETPQEAEQANDDKIVLTTEESEVVIQETEPVQNTDIETEPVEEEREGITDPVEEYTQTASIPKSVMKEIIDGREESFSGMTQKNPEVAEPRAENIPAGSDVPFFEDNISNASDMGEESFNVRKHEYAPYYKHIKEKIRLYWLLQYGTDASINQVTKGYKPIVVTFKVLPTGRITNVEIADAAGNELLASKIQKSIQNTIVNKFPKYIKDAYIKVKFSYFFF